MTTHHLSRTPEYNVWQCMRQRCNNPKYHSFHYYGGRGIQVSPRWRYFEAFLADVGPRPSPQHKLERVRNDGDYEPGNVKWATDKEQARNRRNSIRLHFNGRDHYIPDLARAYRISRGTLYGRIFKLGWSVHKSLLTPVRRAV